MTVIFSQFLELIMSPVEIPIGSYLSDTKMAEREARHTLSSNSQAWNTQAIPLSIRTFFGRGA
jgi:hypothetical protein